MVTTYKQLKVWQKANRLGLRINDVARYVPRNKDGFLADQLKRHADRILHTIEKGSAEADCAAYISLFKDTFDVALQLRRNLQDTRTRGYIGTHAYEGVEKCIDDILVAISRHIRMLEFINSSLDASRAYSYTLLFL